MEGKNIMNIEHLIPQITDTITTSDRIESKLRHALNEVINGGFNSDELLIATISHYLGGQYQVQIKVTQIGSDFIEPNGEANLLITVRE